MTTSQNHPRTYSRGAVVAFHRGSCSYTGIVLGTWTIGACRNEIHGYQVACKETHSEVGVAEEQITGQPIDAALKDLHRAIDETEVA